MVESEGVERVNSCHLNSVQWFLACDVLLKVSGFKLDMWHPYLGCAAHIVPTIGFSAVSVIMLLKPYVQLVLWITTKLLVDCYDEKWERKTITPKVLCWASPNPQPNEEGHMSSLNPATLMRTLHVRNCWTLFRWHEFTCLTLPLSTII